ncbi:hypothetical protein HBI56_110190 [Parastagonospora nodorum]|nr:hypothetical protein HBH53_174640 [Parastagonospora nodorum]KAH3973242.1 hypothetical protein HBH52_142620 [Parastagonospora nodorum]KAH3980837.1 hypothetical protein HBH51_048560 [Parastagonospora nodorum]KAH4004354.1 hypothetical protein HBI10_049530 [Parastagonospora nodorum]KAH4018505.1 hypothetical protein HBI13_133590 [Parastagonospora nodorum]
MQLSTFAFLALAGASLCAALPTDLANFLLVTTAQANPGANTSDLKAVSATSLFDPFNQPGLLLRLTGPGYNSLPTFTISSGTLSTVAQAPFNGGPKLYNSTVVEAGKQLQFLAAVQPTGNLALDENYLLTVNGEKSGWTICDGALDTDVLSWKGTGEGCEATYLHAVTKAPY